MNNHPPPPLIHRPTTTEILKQTTTVVFSTRHHLLPLLFLSFILLFSRYQTESFTHSLTSSIDNSPLFESYFPPKPQVNATLIITDSFNDRKHQDSTALYALVAVFNSYVVILLVYVLSQSFVHGIIFVFVINHIVKNNNPFMNTFRKGVILGLKRVTGIVILRWAIRELLIQILCLWFIGYEDQYSVFKILVRLKFLPFSIGFSMVEGFEKEIFGLLLLYISLDLLVSYIFGVCVWMVMADSRRSCKEVFRDGFRLLLLAKNPAIDLKAIENYFSLYKILLSPVFGEFLPSFMLSFLAIYLIVAWMVYYVSLKSMEANSRGVPFDRREFADTLKDDR